MIDRRTFIRTVAGGLLAAPLAAGAQPAKRVSLIGILTPAPPYESPTGLPGKSAWSCSRRRSRSSAKLLSF